MGCFRHKYFIILNKIVFTWQFHFQLFYYLNHTVWQFAIVNNKLGPSFFFYNLFSAFEIQQQLQTLVPINCNNVALSSLQTGSLLPAYRVTLLKTNPNISLIFQTKMSYNATIYVNMLFYFIFYVLVIVSSSSFFFFREF